MIVKDVEIDDYGQKNYIFGEDLEKTELIEMVAKQMETIHWLRTEIEEMAASINNEAPDLMLRKLTLILERFK